MTRVTWGDIGSFCDAHDTAISGVALSLLVEARAENGYFDLQLYVERLNDFFRQVEQWVES